MRKINFDFSHRTTPFKHQVEALEFIRRKNDVALFDEQGLGKTKVVIDALCENLRDESIDSALIVCKKSLLNTWKKEITKHSYLHPVVLCGSKRERGRFLLQFAHFYLIGYESLVQELEKIEMFLKLRRFAVVLDESHKIKNPSSRVTQSLLRVRELCEKRIIITGTPIANKPDDLWSQFFFLDGGRTLGGSYEEFRDRFQVRLKGKTSLREYEQSLLILKGRINAVSLRRTKDVLELPQKIYTDIPVVLAGRQKIMYEKVKREIYLEIERADGQEVIERIDNYLVKLLRLTQVASNPALIDASYEETPAKFQELDKLVNEIVDRKEKLIIWTSFRKNIRTLRRRYRNLGALMLFGELPIAERNEVVERFMDRDKTKVLIANPSAAGVGLTLTSANNAIYLDRSFKMDEYLQSQDRIHRIGQEKKCNIIKIVAEGTIDEYTDEILQKKHLLAQFTLGDIEHMETDRRFLTKEELLEILG
jgi:SNF2 family DNA or RNA helicase